MTTGTIHIGAVAPAQTGQTSARPQSVVERMNGFLLRFSPVRATDKVSFFRLLATMINAGISIVRALRILENQTENRRWQSVIGTIANRIEAGGSLSQALRETGRYFDEAQIGMVEAGEASGRLNQTLLQIAMETEKSAALTSKIKGAMIYPAVVFMLMLGAGFAVITFVMPRVKEMFDSLGGQLPPLTQLLIAAGDLMTGSTLGIPNVLLVLLVLAGAVFGFMKWKRTDQGRELWGQVILRFPVFGKLLRKVALARFCRSLSTLTGSGISIIKALRITAGGVGSAVYEKRIHKIADDVRQGITMGENMKDDVFLFPTMVVGMISVAEQTAQIDKITEKIAEYYEREVDDMVKNLSSLMEPLIIVVLGAAVGLLVMAVMLPILQSSDLAFTSAQ